MRRRNTNTYRSVYIRHYGLIPKDENGRSYEIHHIDGDHTNDDISNLKAISIQEHYDIHYAQGDWNSCVLISRHMNISHEEKSELARRAALERVEQGTHQFVGESNPVYEQLKTNTHPFQKRADGTSVTSDKVKNGTHPFLGGKIQSDSCNRMLNDGTHIFLKINSYEWTCSLCGRVGKHKFNERRHTDSCKRKILNLSENDK
jgi:hypothetical protein